MMVLAFVFMVGFVEPPKVTVSKETTYITGRLRTGGTPLPSRRRKSSRDNRCRWGSANELLRKL